jgi:GTP pyrophosphokinase
MTEETTIKNILEKTPEQFRPNVSRAYEFAKEQYKGKIRYNGATRMSHALNVALLAASNDLDTNTIIASILHEVPIQQGETIVKNSSKEVLEIVKGAYSIKQATQSTDTDPQLIVKYILASSKDLRPLFIKIYDKLDDVRSIDNIPDKFIKDTLNKSLNVYSPLAEYLFLDATKKEIEEKAFQVYLPQEYQSITKKMQELGINIHLLNRCRGRIATSISPIFDQVSLEGRIKGTYSIYNKLKKYEKEWISPNISSLDDLIAFRIVTNNTDQCFKVLEYIMDSGEIVQEEFDDYISHPKPNGYMAIQFPVKFRDITDINIEIQILTKEMDYNNKYGEASHIAYKASKTRFAKPTNKYDWVREVQEQIQQNKLNRQKYIDLPISCSIYKDEVFAFTPKHKIIQLNKNDTVIDFAFRLHTTIGNSAVSALINGQPAKLNTVINTGDIVEIKVDKNKKHQSENILQYANSRSTKNKIIKYLQKYS